jgi:hypothetical protein
MSNIVYIDEFLQIYSSHGNLHILGGCSTGAVDSSGKDISKEVVHLILPTEYLKSKLPELQDAFIGLLNQKIDTTTGGVTENATVGNAEFEGSPINIKI